MSIDAGSSRRTFLRGAAAAGALVGLDAISGFRSLPAVSAAEAKLDPSLVRLDESIEPMVRVIEQTQRERLIEEVASRIRAGSVSYREVLAGLLLAGVRNVPPRPAVGFKFHAVLVVNSAHLASLASPDADRWLPIFWALDYFKVAQAETVSESGWRMRAVEERSVPPARSARQSFIDAMDAWDESAADVSAAALARHVPPGEVFELFARYAARDFRDIGHKTIFVANSFRTLNCIGWQHAEPVLRSLAFALLLYSGKNPAKSTDDSAASADRPWRRNAKLVKDLRADCMTGENDDPAAVAALLSVLRGGSSDDAAAAVARALNDDKVPPRRVWDALLCAAGERLMRRPGIIALHAVTMTNAMHYCWQATMADQTRRALLFQNASFIPMFGGDSGAGKTDAVRIDQFDAAPDGKVDLPDLFAEVDRDRMNAARMTLRYLRGGGSPADLIAAARRFVFLKGTNSHDYKFSSAVMEDYASVSPGLRDRFLASAMFYLKGSAARDTDLVARTRAALKS